MAERAFLEGRYADLETTLAGARTERDRYPLRLYITWWRQADGAAAPASPPTEEAGGGGARWPLLHALLSDRDARETSGAEGLPARSPLMAYRERLGDDPDSEVLWYLDDVARLMEETYGPVQPLPKTELRRYRSLKWTASQVAMAALGAFVAGTFIAAVVVARRRREDDGA